MPRADPVSGPLPVCGRLVLPAGELVWRFSHGGGPGGQGVNTADSRVELSFDVARSTALTAVARERAVERLAGRLVAGVVTVVAAEHREQHRNRVAARARLARLLRAAVAPPGPARRPTRPSRAAVVRRVAGKRRRGEVKRLRRRPAEREGVGG